MGLLSFDEFGRLYGELADDEERAFRGKHPDVDPVLLNDAIGFAFSQAWRLCGEGKPVDIPTHAAETAENYLRDVQLSGLGVRY